MPPPAASASVAVPGDNDRVRQVRSFAELVATPFAGRVNALCWPRHLPGDFGAVVAQIPADEDLVTLDEGALRALPLRWSPKVGQDGSLTQTQKNDPNVQEATSAQSRSESESWS